VRTLRDRIRRGELRGRALIDLIAGQPPAHRDAFVEELLGVHGVSGGQTPGDDLVGHHATGVDAILHLARAIRPDDVLVDLGSGAGKVTLLVHLLTGIRTHGIEIQEALVRVAMESAQKLGVGAEVTYERGDARDAVLDGTLFFMYLPFTGSALEKVLGQLELLARARQITVCAHGMDLSRVAWLRVRDDQDFWLTIYESIRSPSSDRDPVQR
jgi:hypothetical protein